MIEGSQAIITATMCNENSRIKQVIRGHNGAFEFGNGEQFTEFNFIAERPQVTFDSTLKDETIGTDLAGTDLKKSDTTYLHFKNWLQAMVDGKPEACNNTPDLGAAAVTTVILGAMSHRFGKVYHFDAGTGTYAEGDGSWATKWENLSKQRGKPATTAGWRGGETGMTLRPPEYMSLAGPWSGGVDPAGG